MCELLSLSRMLVISLITLFYLCGCSATKEDELYIERPVEKLYNNAVDEALKGNFRNAAPLFDEVERQHPYSIWATQAQLMAAYSLYQSNQYNEAINALDRFIQLNPGNPNVDYAYYLKGLSFYEQIVDVGREQQLTKNALQSFTQLIKRFPNSKFTRDARLKTDLARNHLAGKEMNIGRFYLRRGQHLAAINRFRTVVQNYDTTEQVPEALHRLTESYMALGLFEEAKKTGAVLGHNYPGSEWYQYSYSLLKHGTQPTSLVKDKSKGWLGLGFWIF